MQTTRRVSMAAASSSCTVINPLENTLTLYMSMLVQVPGTSASGAHTRTPLEKNW
jgi:hypothetical protein